MASRLGFLAILALQCVMVSMTAFPNAREQQAHAATISAPQPTSHQWLGTGSCASMGCHNGSGPIGALGNEYSTWLANDPHARSYERLLDPRSRSIVKNLRLDDPRPAHELPLCLNCHVHKDYEQAAHHSRYTKEDGVGCESCHGPASDWISDHFKPEWAYQSEETKTAQGMWDTRSLKGRIRSCTPCHVGAAGMDVTHDLIAAGHPRLAFEFSAFHALMPRHWQDAKDKDPTRSRRGRPDWDAAAWFVGEAVTAQAALELLEARAESPVWPEFAEFDCYACHHQLRGTDWRRDQTGRKPRNQPWNDWYANLLPYEIYPGSAKPAELVGQLNSLRAVMESKANPDAKAVVAQAGNAIKAFEPLIKQFDDYRYGHSDLATVLKQLARHGAEAKADSWDEAAQTYLAVVAIHQAMHDANRLPARPDVLDALKNIRRELRFEPNTASPRADFSPANLLKSYQILQMRLGS
jgi:hypothetical protein